MFRYKNAKRFNAKFSRHLRIIYIGQHDMTPFLYLRLNLVHMLVSHFDKHD